MDKKNIKPPLLAERLMYIFLPDEFKSTAMGDFEEEYSDIFQNNGSIKAWVWYWMQVIQSIFLYTINSLYWSTSMFKNYLKIMFRNVTRQKLYSFINISGLVLGIVCSLLIYSFIKYEWSYDKYHENAVNIYRIVVNQVRGHLNENQWYTSTPGALKSASVEHFPEVISSTRILKDEGVFEYNGIPIKENKLFYADPEFLDIFSFQLISGDKNTALDDPNSILLTEQMALKYFDDRDPIGKMLRVFSRDYKITGVLKNISKNSHFTFDFLISFNSLYEQRGRDYYDHWRWYGNWMTYVLLHKGSDHELFGEKMTGKFKDFKNHGLEDEFHLQPLTKIHLHSNIKGEIEPNGNIRNIYIFFAAALMILFIACFNYMNLATARSSKRAKEVGMRIVVGAKRSDLIKQFMGESFFYVLLAMFISLVIVNFSLPFFTGFVGIDPHLTGFYSFEMISILIGLTFVLSFISRVYPAFYMSAFNPINVIKGNLNLKRNRSSGFRNTLVVLQFTVSISLIVCSLVVYSQLDYIKKKDLGFTKEHIIYGEVSRLIRNNMNPFK